MFLGYFLDSLSLSLSPDFTLFFPHYFSYTLPLTIFVSFFQKCVGRVFIEGMKKWGASTSVLGYTSASCPFKEAASIGVPW